MRIKFRWEAIDQENKEIELAKETQQKYLPEMLSNGDTLKQLLARSRYLLFKPQSKWTQTQWRRGEILFDRYPSLKKHIIIIFPTLYFFEAMPKGFRWISVRFST